MSDVILVTGSTGFIGGEVLARLLLEGRRVIAVARGPDAAGRVRHRLRAGPLEVRDLRLLDVVEGDVGLPSFGWSPERVRGLGPVGAVLHAAGLTVFDRGRAGEVLRTNHRGSVHAARLARDLRARRLVLVSTAFLGGREGRPVPEGPAPADVTPINPYETSRALAERDVARVLDGTRTALVVARPAIVVNDARTGFALSREHLYALWRPLSRLVGDRDHLRLEARIRALPHGTKNMIPVDAVAAALALLVQAEASPRWVNLVHASPIGHQELLDLSQRALGIEGLRLVRPETWERTPPDRIEAALDRSLAGYVDYLRRREPRFGHGAMRRLHPGWSCGAPLDLDFVRRAFAWFAAREAGLATRAAPRSPARDGPLARYRRDHLEPRRGRRLIPGIGALDAAFTVRLEDGDAPLGVVITNGFLDRTTEHAAGPVTFSLAAETFAEIAAGRLPPVEAFLAGRVDIEGDVEAGLHLVGVLSEFFRLHPFASPERVEP